MNSLFVENLKIYKKFREDNYEPPFYRVTENIFIIMLCLGIVGTILSVLTIGEVVAIPFGVFTFFIIFLGMAISDKKYFQTLFNPLEKAEYYIINHVYSGELSSIFDLSCVHTIKLLKEYSMRMEQNIYNEKGLSGYLVLEILQEIIKEKSEYDLEQKKLEEMAVVKNNETRTGRMLNDIENIKNMQ